MLSFLCTCTKFDKKQFLLLERQLTIVVHWSRAKVGNEVKAWPYPGLDSGIQASQLPPLAEGKSTLSFKLPHYEQMVLTTSFDAFLTNAHQFLCHIFLGKFQHVQFIVKYHICNKSILKTDPYENPYVIKQEFPNDPKATL